MNYLYHSKRKNFRGSILYPLSQLKDVYPDLYEDEIKKYEGREGTMDQTVPILNCLWNDVLHMTAVHPNEVKRALENAGKKDEIKRSYFQIDPSLLDPKKTIVYLYSENGDNYNMEINNFTAYEARDILKYSTMPGATKDYYKESIAQGERPLLYHRIPHILYKGSLDTTNLPILTV